MEISKGIQKKVKTDYRLVFALEGKQGYAGGVVVVPKIGYDNLSKHSLKWNAFGDKADR